MSPLDSPSETVRRHAAAFVRTWPDPDANAIRPHPAPEVRATEVSLDDLELAARLLPDPPGPVRTAVRNAKAGRWEWRVHYGCGRKLGAAEVVSESLVVRARRVDGFAWRTHRVVAVWRRHGERGAWSFDTATRWRIESGRVLGEAERLTAGELGWWLKTGGTSTVNPRPKPRKESAAVAAARARGEFDEISA